MIVKIHRREGHYAILASSVLRNTHLSFKARGLWAMLLSFSDNWEVSISHLCTTSEHDGRYAIQKALQELQEEGLAHLNRNIRTEAGQLIGSRWEIYESPELNPHCGKRVDKPGSYPQPTTQFSGRRKNRPPDNQPLSNIKRGKVKSIKKGSYKKLYDYQEALRIFDALTGNGDSSGSGRTMNDYFEPVERNGKTLFRRLR